MFSIHSLLAGMPKTFNFGPWWHLTQDQFRNFDGCMLNGLSNSIKLKENNPWECSRCSLEWYRFLGSGIKALLSWNVYSLEEPLGANLTLFSSPLVTHLLSGDVVSGMHGRLLHCKDQTHARPLQTTDNKDHAKVVLQWSPSNASHETGWRCCESGAGPCWCGPPPRAPVDSKTNVTTRIPSLTDEWNGPGREALKTIHLHNWERDKNSVRGRSLSQTLSTCLEGGGASLSPALSRVNTPTTQWAEFRIETLTHTLFPKQSAHTDAFCQI